MVRKRSSIGEYVHANLSTKGFVRSRISGREMIHGMRACICAGALHAIGIRRYMGERREARQTERKLFRAGELIKHAFSDSSSSFFGSGTHEILDVTLGTLHSSSSHSMRTEKLTVRSRLRRTLIQPDGGLISASQTSWTSS